VVDQPTSLVLGQLCAIRSKLDELGENDRELRTRLGRIETSLGNVAEHMAEHSVRMDRLHDRLGRVERRLELAEA
jgi:predicted nuclease with TOPRIM domain